MLIFHLEYTTNLNHKIRFSSFFYLLEICRLVRHTSYIIKLFNCLRTGLVRVVITIMHFDDLELELDELLSVSLSA